MKKSLFFFLVTIGMVNIYRSQCPTSSTPTSNCTANNEYISFFGIAGVAATTNSVCATNGYGFYPAPVFTVVLGSTFQYSLTAKANSVVGNDHSFAFWIDLDNDGDYGSNERAGYAFASSPQVTGNMNSWSYYGTFTIPTTVVGGTNLRMRVRSHTGPYPPTNACGNYTYGVTGDGGETEDYQIIFVCPDSIGTVSTSGNTICSGKHVTLTANGASNYVWQPGNLTTSVIVVSPTVSSTYSLNAQIWTGCVAPAHTVMITVNPTPTVSISASPGASICTGETATLSASGANSYVWQPGNLSGANVAVNPASNIIYTITGTSAGCTSARTLNIHVNGLPNVSATTASPVICYNTAANLQASGAVSYTWQPGGLTGSSPSPNLGTSMTFTVTGEDANGCKNNSAVNVSVNPAPAFEYTCNGLIVTLNNTSSNILTGFVWNFGDLTVSNQFQPGTHTYGSAGIYTIELEADSPSPCPKLNVTFTISVPSNTMGGSSGIKENTFYANLISVFPNPAKNLVYIHNEGHLKMGPKLEVYNSLGVSIKIMDHLNWDSEKVTIDVSDLPNGLYFFKLKSAQSDIIKTVIKN
jgi:hypothetical protein